MLTLVASDFVVVVDSSPSGVDGEEPAVVVVAELAVVGPVIVTVDGVAVIVSVDGTLDDDVVADEDVDVDDDIESSAVVTGTDVVDSCADDVVPLSCDVVILFTVDPAGDELSDVYNDAEVVLCN